MISTDREAKPATEHPSPASASSSTLITTPLPSNSDSKDSLALPQVVPRSTKALRPSSLSISLPLSTSSPPPQRMSGKGFVEPHRSHLPRRANTTKSRGSATPRKSFEPPSIPARPANDEDDPFAVSQSHSNGRRHSVNPTSANANNGHMPTHLLSLRIPDPPAPSSLPQTPSLPSRTPQQTPPRISGTPVHTPKGHLEPQSANLPRRHQRSVRAPERDGSPVSKVRHARSMSRSRLGVSAGKGDADDGVRRARSRSAGKAVGDVKEHTTTCLQEMGKGTGVFVGFLPDEESQERLHVVVQSTEDRLVLPLPPLPPPINSSGPSELWVPATCTVEHRIYLDGVTALTHAQLQDGCAFIERAKQTPQDGSESSSKVRILSPRLRPEDAMSLAICYLAYSSPCSINPSPSGLVPSTPQHDLFTPGAARLIPFGANFTQEEITRTRKLSFPGSWDDELAEIDIVTVDSSSQPSPTTKFKEPRYTPAHALYMHLHDDIDSDLDLERELWDAAEEEEEASSWGRTGVVSMGCVEALGRGENGEVEEEQVFRSEGSTAKSAFGAQGSACNRRLDHDDDHDRDRGMEYKCIRAEWRGVLSFDGLKRLDGVWLGAGSS
ncbi:hypothetical protein M413DRAFT_448826 [Hebeloma cylindrosporum]|uniref:Uncharacterized protein n=1 Tax=Hebeloma cylindrosporum TaxID=76867 RepID=A0A0C2Y785_HEBCY|nr:hypothetical protein M413DRAFT_448826 [Hebeloma cylindrosporum h7]